MVATSLGAPPNDQVSLPVFATRLASQLLQDDAVDGRANALAQQLARVASATGPPTNL